MLVAGIGVSVAAVFMTASPAYAGNGDAKAPNGDTIGSVCHSAQIPPVPHNYTSGATNDGSPGRWGILSVTPHANGSRVALEYLGQPPVVYLEISCGTPDGPPVQV